MKCVKVKKKKAQTMLNILRKKDLLNNNYKNESDKNYVYIPVIEDTKKKFPDLNFIDKNLVKVETKDNLKQMLENKLSKKELDKLITSFDVIGNIAIIQVPDELIKKQKVIAQCLLKLNKNIKTVLKRAGIHKGEFRTLNLEHIAGIDTKQTIHKENGVKIKLDVEKVYFSPRSSTERKRISGLVKDEEKILVMFSGCAPFPLVLAKNTNAQKITGVELNPIAHKYAKENLTLNKINNIELYLGDVRKIVPTLAEFDRILMPLPKTGEDFLDIALNASKNKSIIHFYDFSDEKDFPDLSINKIKKAAEKFNLSFKVLDSVKCGDYSPGVHRVCIDFQITKICGEEQSP